MAGRHSRSALLLSSMLFAVNITAAVKAPILDCDEVFNYWEPTHYLLYGNGRQTWEYAPQYALRSWLYVSMHAAFSSVFSINSKIAFFGLRIVLAMVCTSCQCVLLQSIMAQFGFRMAGLMTLVMGSTSGFFYASVAFLPSSFAMYTVMLAFAFTQPPGGGTRAKVVALGIGAIVGWPFCAILLGPLLWDEMCFCWEHRSVLVVAKHACQGLGLLLPVIVMDLVANHVLFGRWTFSPWQIVSYNIFGGTDRGPEIFGVEPWHFYVRNLLLNFNLWFVLALIAAPLLLLTVSPPGIQKVRTLMLTSPFYLWLVVFSVQPHKEERFMYPAYPFLCFNAAIASHTGLMILGRTAPSAAAGRIKAIAVAAILVAVISLGCLRTAGSVSAYGAPMRVYAALADHAGDNLTTVCVGKEWYRFPSSFFLPPHMRLQFVKSEFRGLLPGQFLERPPSRWSLPPAWHMPDGMNDQNVEDPGKYVIKHLCQSMLILGLP